MNYPKYPDDFFSYEYGTTVSANEINNWIKYGINKMESNSEIKRHRLSSGDTLVEVFRLEPTEGKYEIIISKNYSVSKI